MSGTLYVVATPIGNLEDITLRALRVLREVDVIAAEDTRRTARLLAHYGIPTPTTSFHQHNARSRTPHLLDKLRSGRSVALVTDAGTPSVSDPGAELVAACVEAEIPVDPIPGASAPLTAAMASGFPLDELTILGFAPSRSKDRNDFISTLNGIAGVIVFFEAPHRIRQTLDEMAHYFGERQIVMGRELTKAHQEFLRGTAADVLSRLGEPKGEFTVVVGPGPSDFPTRPLPADDVVAAEFGVLTNNVGAERRAVMGTLARKYGRSVREVYAALERAKKSGERP